MTDCELCGADKWRRAWASEMSEQTEIEGQLDDKTHKGEVCEHCGRFSWNKRGGTE